MLKPGAVLDLGPLNTKFSIKKTAAETNGQAFEMEWELGPQTGGTPIHIHPDAVETYEVLEGELDVYLDGSWKTMTVGERFEVPKGTPHTFRNATDETTRVYNTHQPAMKFDEYFEGLSRLVERGIIRSQKMTPKAVLHLAALMTSYKDEIQPVNPPPAVMQILAYVAKLLRYRV